MILLRSDSATENRATAEVRAPAKLNLSLEVLGRREDGYHELASVMVPLGLHDTVIVTRLPASGTASSRIDRFPPTGPLSLKVCPRFGQFGDGGDRAFRGVPEGDANLAYRAVARLREMAGVPDGAHIVLVKRIPAEAGLGGGSSDAAAALVAANAVWGLRWDRARLSEVAAEMGSDVPFFLAGQTAFCCGRGEDVHPIDGASRLPLVVVQPTEGLSTAAVFRAFDEQAPMSAACGDDSQRWPYRAVTNAVDADERPVATDRVRHLVAALQAGRLAELGRSLFNQLQQAAARLNDSIDRLGVILAELDVVGHSMTGSGSASFAICRNALHARRVATTLRARFPCWVCPTHSCP